MIQTLEEAMNELNFKQPNIIPLTDRLYRLEEDYVFTWTILRCRADRSVGCTWQRITIPKGFVYDGATVPRWLWTLTWILPDGVYRAAALMHDWMYAHHGFLPDNSYEISLDNGMTWESAYGKWSRKSADLVFRKLMREGEISIDGHLSKWMRWKIQFMYLLIRFFGSGHWDR